MHRAVHRLHGGMGQEGHVIIRLDLLGRPGDGLLDIALLGADHARLRGRRFELLQDVARRELGIGPFVPGDLQRLHSLLGRAHMIGHHGDRIVELHHLAHALHRQRLAVVDLGELAAEDR